MKEIGLQRAKEAADHAGDEWKGAAYQAFVQYAREHKTFTTEEVRKANPDLPSPPDQRAWGHIAKSAERREIVEAVGFKRAQSSNGRVSVLWGSMLI